MSNIFEICCFCLPVQLVKLCISMIDAGKAYNAANKQFVSGIRELAQQSTTDEVIEVKENVTSLKTFSLNHLKKTTVVVLLRCVHLLGLCRISFYILMGFPHKL